jgi:hypothetical protein
VRELPRGTAGCLAPGEAHPPSAPRVGSIHTAHPVQEPPPSEKSEIPLNTLGFRNARMPLHPQV